MTQQTRQACRVARCWLAFAACLSTVPCEGRSTIPERPETQTANVEPTTPPAAHPADTGILKINGKFIKSLQLERRTDRGADTVTLDSPSAEVRLPAGDYMWHRIELQEGRSPRLSAWGYSSSWGHSAWVHIAPGQTTTLTIGGPVKQQLQATARGSVIEMTFSLIGAGGETYTRTDRQSPPGFAVTQGDRRIGSGTFEYG